VSRATPAWIALAVAAEAVAYLGYAVAYREVARVEGGPVLPRAGAAALVAAGFGPFATGGGFHVDLQALRGTGIAEDDARARVLGLGALEYLVLAPAACTAALLLIAGDAPVGGGFTYPWAIAVPAGFVAAAAALALRRRAHGRLRQALDALYVLRCLLARPLRHGLPAVAGTALYWLGDVVALWACLRTFGGHDPAATCLLLGYATGYALTRRTLPLGGAGVVEALLPFALTWTTDVGLAQAALGVLAYRLVNLWLPLAPAALAIPRVRRLPDSLRR
jgi:uncharacterized membrane protein YbhN (UPF0104 family)